MELEVGQPLCALDNPIVAAMQLFLIVNFSLFTVSALLLLSRLLRHAPSLPPWCRAYSGAALAVHTFWCLICLFVVSVAFASSPDEAVTFLLSAALPVVLLPSLIGLLLAWRVRGHAVTDWTPALFPSPTAPEPSSAHLPHA